MYSFKERSSNNNLSLNQILHVKSLTYNAD